MLIRALPTLCKVRTFADVLLLAVQALFTVTQHGKVTTYTRPRREMHMRERAACTSTATVIAKVHTQRCAFRNGFVRERTRLGRVRASSLQERPADSNLGRVVLIWAGEPTIAGTSCGEAWTRLVNRLLEPSRLEWPAIIIQCHILMSRRLGFVDAAGFMAGYYPRKILLGTM